MKRTTTIKAGVAAALALGLGASAHAVPFTFDITSAAFRDAFPGSATFTLLDEDATAGTETVEFGDPAGATGPGRIVFGDSTPVSGSLGDTFDIGTFTHDNFPLFAGTGIDGATLDIIGDLTIDGTLFSGLTFSYLVEIDNTPNTASECPADSVPCDDIITISTLDSSAVVEFMGEELTVNIVGFFLDGLATTEFATVEGLSNTAIVRASISEFSEIPVPGAIWLMGAGTALLLRRKRA